MEAVNRELVTVDLASNASLENYPDNFLSSFRTCLSEPLELSGDSWTVSLIDITYPRTYNNIVERTFDYTDGKIKWVKDCQIEKGVYNSVSDIISEMKKSSHIKGGRWNKGKVNHYLPTKFESGIWQLEDQIVCSHSANVSSDLRYILGLKMGETSLRNPLNTEKEYAPAYPVDVNRNQVVYVYCDFIEPQYVENTRAPLLRTFPLFDL